MDIIKNSDMEEFIKGLPKAELHLHLEGSMTVERLINLGQKNSVPLPSLEEIRRLRSSYNEFLEFEDEYIRNLSVVSEMEDYYNVTMDYLTTCADQNILYTEIQFCPIPYLNKGFTFEEIMNTLLRASQDAYQSLGVRSNFILTLVTHLQETDNLNMIKLSAPFKDQIIAIGMAGVEEAPKKFKHLFEEARKIGYKNFTSHSGEFGEPDFIIDTLYSLQVNRIDHGVRCLDDIYLVEFLKQSDIYLTICPLSNLTLKVIEKFFGGNSYIERIIDSGLKITINSDDPTLLGGYLNENFLYVAKNLEKKGDLEVKKILAQLAKNSFLGSFLPEDLKKEYIKKVDEYLESRLS